ncbi:ribosomal protein S18-alanine N-acetyltransferase [archaeon]|jgi:[ribosomal protein S18]-alanine N-acetyltransferase|nr:ribosomal protein S18-alanine N-acetyltransferase [archaeon]
MQETKTKKNLPIIIRPLHSKDYSAVLSIETDSFEFQWLRKDFIRALNQTNIKGKVAEYEGKVKGFMIYELYKHKINIPNIATAADFLGKGVGSKMVSKLIKKLSFQRKNRITLEVRETNLPAQLFFRSQGFRATKILRNYYENYHEDVSEDAYRMEYRFGNPYVHLPFTPKNRISKHFKDAA